MRILLATGNDGINNAVKSLGYQVVGEIYERSELRDSCKNLSPCILLISENLKGLNYVLIEELLFIKSNYSDVRIIYLAGNVDLKNKDKVNRLASLVFAGVYDIYCERKISINILQDLIESPKGLEDVEYLTRYLRKEYLTNESFVEIDDEDLADIDVEKNGYSNVVLISSVKPGTGKSFIACNIAAGLATYGCKEDGSPLKILVIDADLQNLSIGTLLDIEDDKYNLKTLSKSISQVLDNDGNIVGSSNKILEVNNFIKKACLPSRYVKNLWAITGSQINLEDADKMNPYMFVYMVEVLSRVFDYVIIDSNSSLFHKTTYPMLRLAGKIFYVTNLDYNNIRNNQRYKRNLKDLEVDKKIKWLLNEDVTNKNSGNNESLMFTSEYIENKIGFDFVAKIPVIEKTIFLNRVFRGIPLIVDDKKYTLAARVELLKLVNDIHPIGILSKVEEKLNKLNS